MFLIKNPTLYAWAGISFGFLTYRFSNNYETLSYCDTYVWLFIPMVVLLVYPFIYKIIRLKFVVGLFSLLGLGSLFLPQSWSFILGLTSLTLMFLPAIFTNFRTATWGITASLMITWILHFFDVIPEISYGILILLVFIFLFFYFRNVFPEILWKNSFKIQNLHQLTLFLLWIFGMSLLILLVVWVCFFATHSALPGFITGLFIFGLSQQYFSKFQNKWSQPVILGSIFILFFISMVLHGYMARSFGMSFLIISTILWAVIGVVIPFCVNEIKKGFDVPKSDFFTEKKLYFSLVIFLLLFLLLDTPACYIWLSKIKSMALPENLFSLSLSQYKLKNITILPAINTILAGILFLNRRRWYGEKNLASRGN